MIECCLNLLFYENVRMISLPTKRILVTLQ